MSGGTRTLKVVILGNATSAKKAMAELDAAAGTQSTVIGKLGAAHSKLASVIERATKLSTIVTVAAGVAAIKMTSDFQTSMTRIQTQAGESAADVSTLTKGILGMAASVGTTPGVLADAAYHIASIGKGSLTTAQQLNILRISAEGAKVGGADLVDVTNALDAAVVSGIKGVSDYSNAMGVLNATVGAGDMSMQDLADAMGTGILAAARTAGLSITDIGAALAVFGDNNIRGAAAATKLRQAIMLMVTPSDKAAGALASIGIGASQLGNDMRKPNGLLVALQDMQTHLQNSGKTATQQAQIISKAFGGSRTTGTVEILLTQLTRLQNKYGDVTEGGKTFAQSWQTYTKTFAFAADQVKAAIETGVIFVVEKALPGLTDAMHWIGNDGVADLEKFAHALADNSMVKGGFGALGDAIKQIVTAIGNLIHAAEPLGKVLLAVAGGAVIAAFDAWAHVLDAVYTILAKLTGFLAHNQVVFDALAGVIAASLVPALATAVAEFSAMIALGVESVIRLIWTSVVEMATAFGAADGAVAGFGAALEALSLNPATIALVAVGAAVGVLAHSWLSSRDAVAAAKKSVDDYTASLHTDQNSIESLQQSISELSAHYAPQIDLLKKLEGSNNGMLSSAARSTLANSEATKQLDALHGRLAVVTTNTMAMAREFGLTVPEVQKLAAAGIDLGAPLNVIRTGFAEAVTAAKLTHHPVQQAAADFQDLGSKANTLQTDLDDLDTAWQNLVGNFIGMKVAEAEAGDSLAALKKALKASGDQLGDSNGKTRAATESLGSFVGSLKTVADAVYTQTGSYKKTKDAVASLVSKMTADLPKGSKVAQQVTTDINRYLGNLANKAKTEGAATGKNFANGIASGKTPAITSAGQVVGAAMARFGQHGDVGSLGTSLAQGFAAGMQSGGAFAAVATAAAVLVSHALASIKSAQDSHSPAKKFIPLGNWAGEGYAFGIEKSAPAVEKAAKSVVDRVYAVIAKATAPAITNPSALASILGLDINRAEGKTRTADAAHDAYREATESLNALKRAHNAAETAAKSHATALSNAAHKAHELAANMSGSTKAAEAAKQAAEAHARSLDDDARAATQAAEKLSTANQKTEQSAEKAAEKAKKAWDKAKQAAKNAQQAAATAGQAIVSSLQDSADQMLSTIQDFQSSIASGLVGDDSLSTLWGNLVDAQSQAASDLASAQQNFTDAQQAVTDAGADASTDQLNALATAQAALTAAQNAASQANSNLSVNGLQSNLNSILAQAQQFASDLQSLIGDGAGQALVSQLVGMGPQAGDQLAQQLLAAGSGSIDQLSGSLDQIASFSQSAAQQLSEPFFGAGETAAENFIKALEAKFPELKAALDPILAELVGIFGGSGSVIPAVNTEGLTNGSSVVLNGGAGNSGPAPGVLTGTATMSPGAAYASAPASGGSVAVASRQAPTVNVNVSFGDLVADADTIKKTVHEETDKAIDDAFEQIIREFRGR